MKRWWARKSFMTDDRGMIRTALLCVVLASTGCVTARNDNPGTFSKGDQYLRYGVEAYAAGQPAVAESRFQWALGVFEKDGNLDGQIRAHINLAEQAFQSGDPSRADAHLQRAEALVARSGESRYVRRIRLIQSSAALSRGDYQLARSLLTGLLGSDECQAAIHATDALAVYALANRAALSGKSGDGELSCWTQQFKRALNVTDNPDPYLNARLLRFEAELLRGNSEYDRSDALFSKALAFYQSGRRDSAIAATLQEWAELDMERGRWAEAGEKLRRSVLARDSVGDREGVIAGLRMLVTVETKGGHPRQADALAQLVSALQSDSAVGSLDIGKVIDAAHDSD